MAGTLNVAAPRSERDGRRRPALTKRAFTGGGGRGGGRGRTSVKRNVCARFAEYCGGDVHPRRDAPTSAIKMPRTPSYAVAERNTYVGFASSTLRDQSVESNLPRYLLELINRLNIQGRLYLEAELVRWEREKGITKTNRVLFLLITIVIGVLSVRRPISNPPPKN